MGDAIHGGDVLHILSRERPREGEVWLAVVPDGRLVAHRVVRVAPDLVHLAGDAAGRVDPPLAIELLVGRVVAVRRNGRDVKLRRDFLPARQFARLRRRLRRRR